MRSLAVLLLAVSACSIELVPFVPPSPSMDAGAELLTAIHIVGPSSIDRSSAVTLTANCEYSSGVEGTCPLLSWRSSAPMIAAVDARGLVTAARNGGVEIVATHMRVESAPHAISVLNPVPAIAAIDPASAVAGRAALLLAISGGPFFPDSIVSFGGEQVPIVSRNSGLVVEVPAASLAEANVVEVVVENAGPGGGRSMPAWFTITDPPPELQEIIPGTLFVGDGDVSISFRGAGFVAPVELLVNGVARPAEITGRSSGVAQILSSELAAPAVLQISVRNSGSRTVESNVLPLNVRLGPMPAFKPRRTNFGTAISGDFLYVAGGTGLRPNDSDAVSFTRINENGTIEPWQLTAGLLNGLSQFGFVAHKGRLYAIGGIDLDGNPREEIYMAEVLSDGHLGPWLLQPAILPSPRGGQTAFIFNDRLFVIGGRDASSAQPAVFVGTFDAAGTIISLTQGSNPGLSVARLSHGAVALRDHLFVFGGTDLLSVLDSTEAAIVRNVDQLGPWESDFSLPVPLRNVAAATDNSNIFALGGATDMLLDSSVSEAWSAPVDLATGMMSAPWRSLGSFDVPRSGAGAVFHRGYLYLLGGFAASRGFSGEVQRAHLTADGLLDGEWSPLSFRVPFVPDASCLLLLDFDGSTRNACGAGSGLYGGAEYTFVPSSLGSKLRATGNSEESAVATQLVAMQPPSATIEMTIESFGDAFEGRDRGVLYSDLDALADPALTRGVQISVYNDGRLGITTRDGSSAGTTIETDPGIIAAGAQQAQHVKVTIDAGLGIRLYVDGAELTLTAAAYFPPLWAASAETGWIGAAREGSTGAMYRFNGSFDEVRISDVIRE